MERNTYIGGTDLAAICGVHPYKTAHQVWLEKTGRGEPKQTNLAMRIGIKSEPVIASLYEEETGLALDTISPVRHREIAFLGGSPDRIVRGEPLTVELKTANIRTAHRWGEAGTDEVPEEYLLQVMHYLAVMDHDRADLAVLLGGADFRVYHILRDRDLEAELIERASRFWVDHVQADKPPPVDGSDGAAEMLAKIHAHRGPEKLPPSADGDALVAEYAKARSAREAWEAKEKLARQRIEAMVGNAGGLLSTHGTVCISSVRGRVKTDWEAVATEAGVPKSLIQKHTTIGAPYPRFAFKPNNPEERS